MCTDVSPRPHAPLPQPVVTSARPASASAVAMAAASTQTQDECLDVGPVQNVMKVNESGCQTVAHDGMRSAEPPWNKSVSDISARNSAGTDHADYSSGLTDRPGNTAQRSSAVSILGNTTSAAPSFIDRQTARVRPRILTHVIEGFVIQEASEPFPVCNLCAAHVIFVVLLLHLHLFFYNLL